MRIILFCAIAVRQICWQDKVGINFLTLFDYGCFVAGARLQREEGLTLYGDTVHGC